MTTYIYNGKILIKNSKRDNYKFACICKEDGHHIQISSTREGADVERKRRMTWCREEIANYRNALQAIEAGKDFYIYKFGREPSRRCRIDHYKKDCFREDERALEPKEYYTKQIEKAEKRLKDWLEKYEIVEVEKR